MLGGKFLEFTKVAKPGSDVNDPVFYTAQDLLLGETIQIFKHKFVIRDADEYVLKYMEARPDEFSQEAIEALSKKRRPPKA